MRNCIILGSGRSGTSMTGGVLAESGYFMGNRLYAADEGNSKGYFEDEDINSINEDLLASVFPYRPTGLLGQLLFKHRMSRGQRWLVDMPLDTQVTSTPGINALIQKMVLKEPYCYKDPRFSYTLPAWRPFLRNVVFICVFRQPAATAHSIMQQCQREGGGPISHERALRVWESMYRHILELHYRADEDWLFIHYDQFLDGSVFDRLEKILGTTVDRSFVEPRLRRSMVKDPVTENLLPLYARLCALAGHAE